MLGLVGSSTLFGVLPARAQTNNATDPESLYLTTSPLPVNLVAKPGETVETELRVKNGGSKTEILKVGLLKFAAYGEEGKPELKDREIGDNYFDWVRFSETQFAAEPDTWHTITMYIDVPTDAALGYYYAVTFSRLNTPQSSQSNKLQGGTAILVLLEARIDNAKRELQIEEFQAGRRIYEFLPATFTIKLNNTGNIHLPPTGNIFIKRGDQTIAVLDVNKGAGNVLPGSKRIFSSTWSDGFPVYESVTHDGQIQLKDGQQQLKLHWDFSKIGHLKIGKYTAQLVMSYDDGNRDVPLEATLTFWVIPWRIIIFTLLPLVVVGILTYSYFRLRGRYKKLRNSKEL